MSNKYHVIDEKNWKRSMHCQIFRNSVEPAFCVTFELDITNFLPRIKEKNYSFTNALDFLHSYFTHEFRKKRKCNPFI